MFHFLCSQCKRQRFSKKGIEYESDLRLPTHAGLAQGSDFLSGPASASGRGHRAGETGPAPRAASSAPARCFTEGSVSHPGPRPSAVVPRRCG